MENLTKENFFNELQKKYPAGMKVFCDWIDEYKKKNDWDRLFRERHHERAEGEPVNFRTPKYHDLPLAMQVGIWLEFVAQFTGSLEWVLDSLGQVSAASWEDEITQHTGFLEENIEEVNRQLNLIKKQNNGK